MDGAHVLITGVHKGFGNAIARALLDRGAYVYGLSRVEPEDLADDPRWRFGSVDLADLDGVGSAVARLLDGVPELRLVILNAGVLGEIKDLAETSVAELRAVMDVNVWANKNLLDALLGHGRRVEQVIGISSGAAQNGSGGWGAYSISKAALNLLLRVSSDEHPDVHFASVAPGVIYTDMIRYILARPEHPHHPSLERIRAADRDGAILEPREAAANLIGYLDRIRSLESGSFVDLRTIDG